MQPSVFAPNLLKYNSSTEVGFRSSAIDTLQGNTGGLNLVGGTAGSDSIELWANDASWDSDNTGRIILHDRQTWIPDDGDVTIDAVFQAPIFFTGNFAYATTSGTVRMSSSVNTPSVSVITASHIMEYSTASVLANAPTFNANTTIRSSNTTTQTDLVCFMASYFSLGAFENNQVNATTKTTSNISGLIIEPKITNNASAHASSAVVVTDVDGVAINTLGLANIMADSRHTITNISGYKYTQPLNTGGGTLTNQRGLVVESLALGTNNVGLLNGTLTSPSGNYSQYNASTNPNYFAGAIQADAALYESSLTNIAFADTPYTVVSTDRYIFVDTSSGAVTINLPAATGSGRRIDVKVVDATNNTTVDGSGTETIDGATTDVLSTAYESKAYIDSASGKWSIV